MSFPVYADLIRFLGCFESANRGEQLVLIKDGSLHIVVIDIFVS